MRIVSSVVFAAALLLPATPIWAQQPTETDRGSMTKEERRLQREARRIDREAAGQAGEERVLARMSSDLNIPVETLKQQKQTSGLSFGNLFIANALAKASGKTFEQIAAASENGRAWGRVARENNLRLGEVISAAKRNANALEASRRNEERRAAREAMQRQHGQQATVGRGPGIEHGKGSAGQGRPPSPARPHGKP